MKIKTFFLLTILLFLSACSTKEVFKPKVLGADWEKYAQSEGDLVDTSYNVALLDNKKVLTKSSIVDMNVAKNQRLISHSDGWIISASIDGELLLTSQDDVKLQEKFQLKKTIASASVKGDNLAVVFADNELAVYSIASKALIFKEQGTEPLVVNTQIVNPFFINNLVFFGTLDGKVVIVNLDLKKKLRTVTVSAEENFNNIIYFNMIGNRVIAATGYKILSMAEKEIRVKYETRNIVYDGKDIFITTKQGEVISFTPTLELNARIKFPFAHFLGMISDGDNLYILEKEGYMIILNKNMKDYSVHEVDMTEDGFIFIAGKTFYVADKKIVIK